jgi:hypothetical protein
MKRSELNNVVFAYILGCIDGDCYGETLTTDAQKLKFLADVFRSEYCYPKNLQYYGSVQSTLKNWFMGLPSACNIDYENYRIIELAKKWGCLAQDADDRQEDKIIDNWFNWMANKTIQLMKKYEISIY